MLTKQALVILLVLSMCSCGQIEGQVEKTSSTPLGIVQIIDEKGQTLGQTRVDIWMYGTIYSALGVTSQQFSDWERLYGMDSLGVGSDGSIFIPDYPVLSKVAWTYIDPVDLSDFETRALIAECEKAIAETDDDSARKLLGDIRDLASEAIRQSATIRFGHP